MFGNSKTRFTLKSFRAGRLLRRLAHDRRAGVAMALGLTVIPLVGTVGLSVDFSRAYLVKSRLSHAIDAAALAGGSNVDAATLDADIRMYFDANYTPGFMGSYISDFKSQLGSDKETVLVEATAQVPTTFSRVLGFNYISVHAANMARLSVRGMELVLVMDNTGSMRSGGKMMEMKLAAKELIDILYGGRETVNKFYVGLVPYAATVNIGNWRTGWLDDFDPPDYTPTVWKGCVEARNAPFDQDDTPPTVEDFEEHFWETTINDYAAERAANGWIGD
ncbi:MAG: pilus assembly protein, partial [Alphaproteobacteria bacterium]